MVHGDHGDRVVTLITAKCHQISNLLPESTMEHYNVEHELPFRKLRTLVSSWRPLKRGITFGLPPPGCKSSQKMTASWVPEWLRRLRRWSLIPSPLLRVRPRGNRPACSSLIAENFDYKSLPWTISSGSRATSLCRLSKGRSFDEVFFGSVFHRGKGFFFVVFWACVFFPSPKNIEK